MIDPRDEPRRTRRQRPERGDRFEIARSDRRPPNAEYDAEFDSSSDDLGDAEWRRLLSELSDPRDLPTLDVSDAVLAKLGYRRASRRRARIAAMRRLGRRLGGVSLALCVLGAGLFSVDWSTRAAAPTLALDQSIRDSMRAGSARLGTVAEGLRPVSELPLGRLLAIDPPALVRGAAGADDLPSALSSAPAFGDLEAPQSGAAPVGPRRQRPSIRVPQWPADAMGFPVESVPTTVAAIAPLKNT